VRPDHLAIYQNSKFVLQIAEVLVKADTLKYSSNEIIPSSCRCSILLGLTFVEIRKDFTKIFLIFKS
jgi:hypothetical protein